MAVCDWNIHREATAILKLTIFIDVSSPTLFVISLRQTLRKRVPTKEQMHCSFLAILFSVSALKVYQTTLVRTHSRRAKTNALLQTDGKHKPADLARKGPKRGQTARQGRTLCSRGNVGELTSYNW